MWLRSGAFITFLAVAFSVSAVSDGTVSLLAGGQEWKPDYRYGLYYADWKKTENTLSLVIGSDGKAIAPPMIPRRRPSPGSIVEINASLSTHQKLHREASPSKQKR